MRVYVVGRGESSISPHWNEGAWTAFSDVGDLDVQGHRISLDEYLRTEAAYVDMFTGLVREAGRVIVAEPRISERPEPWIPDLVNGQELLMDVATSLFKNQLRGSGIGCSFYLPDLGVRIRPEFDYCVSIEAEGSFEESALNRFLSGGLSVLEVQERESLPILERDCDDEFWAGVIDLLNQDHVWIAEKFAQGSWGQDWYRVSDKRDVAEVRRRVRTYSAVHVLKHLDYDVVTLDEVFDERSLGTAALTKALAFRYPVTRINVDARPLDPTLVREQLGSRSTYGFIRSDVIDLSWIGPRSRCWDWCPVNIRPPYPDGSVNPE